MLGGIYTYFNPYEKNRYVDDEKKVARERGIESIIINATNNTDDRLYEFYIIQELH